MSGYFSFASGAESRSSALAINPASIQDPDNALTNYHLGMALDPNLGAAPDARRALAELQVP